MKNTLIIVVAIAILVAGYFFFIQNDPVDSTSGQKIDINMVCEGALAYMTFQSGEEAVAFVEACKAGEHPEVIERYKADMGLGAGAAI